jgi:hypothetical protein
MSTQNTGNITGKGAIGHAAHDTDSRRSRKTARSGGEIEGSSAILSFRRVRVAEAGLRACTRRVRARERVR